MQNMWKALGGDEAPLLRATAALMDSCRSDISPTPSRVTTCCRRLLRKKCHASEVSPSTIANAIGTILLLPSCETATNKQCNDLISDELNLEEDRDDGEANNTSMENANQNETNQHVAPDLSDEERYPDFEVTPWI
ncbi:uncharacterized protein DS421_14g466030 [Arachis hypogaea]|nr:uncharacterized protein DS421_14g466030 [Arachis hypogaea]